MRSGTTFIFLTLLALACAGCGKAATSATSNTATTATATIPQPAQQLKYAPVRSASYTVVLSGSGGVAGADGAPPGAPNASGLAVISINAPKRRLCWKFSQLQNVKAPTLARVYYRAAGLASWRGGFRLGRTYKPSGCIPLPEGTQSVEYGPQEWWVSIHTAHYPGGAVRGQV